MTDKIVCNTCGSEIDLGVGVAVEDKKVECIDCYFIRKKYHNNIQNILERVAIGIMFGSLVGILVHYIFF